MKSILLVLFISSAYTEIVLTQSNDMKSKLAQNYERGGDWEKAISLYEELFRNDSANTFYFDALRRGYLQLKKYENAISICENRLKKTPNDIALIASLGSVFAKAEKESLALLTWERGIALDRRNFVVYKIVADAAQENRMWETAIAFYLRGRTEIGNKNLFVTEIGSLYAMTMQYKNAAREFLLLLNDTPQQLSLVQTRLSSFTGKKEGLVAATEMVIEANSREKNNLQLKRLLAWLLMEGKLYSEALNLYREIDEQTRANGNELYNFAERVFRDKEFFIAAQAYYDVIRLYPRFPMIATAQFGFAQCLEKLSETLSVADSTTSRKFSSLQFRISFEDAVSTYRTLASTHNKSELGTKCLLQISMIQSEHFNNSSEALATLGELKNNVPLSSPLRIDGIQRTAEIHLQLGDTALAEKELRSILQEQRILSSQKELAQFRLAEIYYFKGNFQEVSKHLEELTKVLATDIANDALSLSLFIETHRGKEEFVLKKFAAADFLARQNNYSEAITAFQHLVENFSNSELADDALLKTGELQYTVKQYSTAISTLQKIYSHYSESMLRDNAMMMIAKIYDYDEKNIPKAIESYEIILHEFPKSLFVEEARKRIRVLRGDTL
ncbi:MAG: tetratricopeptide repeat protein [Ignavibacteria bacterium]|nr:tetratricopeptide repeat protein [Ignavibacteria bacterium]